MLDTGIARRTESYLQARALRTAVERHARSIWGEDYAVLRPIPAPAAPLEHVQVVRIPLVRGVVRCAYLTCGAALAGKGREREFLFLARKHAIEHVDTVVRAVAAHFRFPNGLSHGDVVDLGRPWTEGAEASRLLVSLPHRRWPPVGAFALRDRTVQVLCLSAISDAEADFAGTQGCAALQRKLDESGADLTDPYRSHVL